MKLISDSNSKIAHLSEDGKAALCQRKVKHPIAGSSMGFVGATKRCKSCPQDAFILYFDTLRRGIAYDTDRDFNLSKRSA